MATALAIEFTGTFGNPTEWAPILNSTTAGPGSPLTIQVDALDKRRAATLAPEAGIHFGIQSRMPALYRRSMGRQALTRLRRCGAEFA